MKRGRECQWNVFENDVVYNLCKKKKRNRNSKRNEKRFLFLFIWWGDFSRFSNLKFLINSFISETIKYVIFCLLLYRFNNFLFFNFFGVFYLVKHQIVLKIYMFERLGETHSDDTNHNHAEWYTYIECVFVCA